MSEESESLNFPTDFLSVDEYRDMRRDIASRIAEVDAIIGWETPKEASGFYATAILSAGYRKPRYVTTLNDKDRDAG